MSLMSFALSFFVFSCAESIVLILFGNVWEGSIIVFKFISLTMMFTLITNNISTSILYALGRVKFLFYLELISNIIFLALLYFFSRHGLIYVLVTRLVFTILVSSIIQFVSNKELKISNASFIKLIFSRFLVSFLLALICFFLFDYFKITSSTINSFIIVSLIYIIGYVSYLYSFEKKHINKLKNY